MTPPPGSDGRPRQRDLRQRRHRRWSRRSSARRSASSPASISPNTARTAGSRRSRASSTTSCCRRRRSSSACSSTRCTSRRSSISRAGPGSLALALIAIPVVVRTTENMLQLVPNSLREAAVALGAPMWKVILTVTLQGRPRRRHHRHPARGRAHLGRNRAAAVHRAQQPVLEREHERADGESAGGDLPVRDEPVRRLAGCSPGAARC